MKLFSVVLAIVSILWSGGSLLAASSHAFLWKDGHMKDLGTLGGSNSTAFDVNNNGQVVGSAQTAQGEERAFLWSNGSMINLGTLGGTYSRAQAVNDLGQVVGVSEDADGRERAFLWDGGTMIDLAGSQDSGNTVAYGINNVGQIIGWFFVWENGNYRPFPDGGYGINDQGKIVADIGGFALLTTFSGERIGFLADYVSIPRSINNAEQVVGTYSQNDNGVWQAVMWADGRMMDLGGFGGTFSSAYAINEVGQVAGLSQDAEGQQFAFLWSNGVMENLGTLGGAQSSAYGINDAGEVVGSSEVAPPKKPCAKTQRCRLGSHCLQSLHSKHSRSHARQNQPMFHKRSDGKRFALDAR